MQSKYHPDLSFDLLMAVVSMGFMYCLVISSPLRMGRVVQVSQVKSGCSTVLVLATQEWDMRAVMG